MIFCSQVQREHATNSTCIFVIFFLFSFLVVHYGIYWLVLPAVAAFVLNGYGVWKDVSYRYTCVGCPGRTSSSTTTVATRQQSEQTQGIAMISRRHVIIAAADDKGEIVGAAVHEQTIVAVVEE